jgi:Fe-S cluster biogenesis protein NfuA
VSVEGLDTLDDARRGDLERLMGIMGDAVAADGGTLRLTRVDGDTGTVHVELSGACSSCAVSSVTLTDGVRRALLARLDWVTDVIGTIDDSIDDTTSAQLGRGGYTPKGDQGRQA